MENYIKDDLYRYGLENLNWKGRLFQPLPVRYIKAFRRVQSCENKILKKFYHLSLQRLSNKTHIQIPYQTRIGRGFYIGHTGRIIINEDAVLGENVNIATGVTIGQSNRGSKKGSPAIGNRVWIGTNAVIVGRITIGNNVLIAPNAFVNMDVPDNSVVIGNPAVIHENIKATEGYLNRCV